MKTIVCRECNTAQTTLQGENYLFYCTNCGAKIQPLDISFVNHSKTEKLPPRAQLTSNYFSSRTFEKSSDNRKIALALSIISLVLIASLVTGWSVYVYLIKTALSCPKVVCPTSNQLSAIFTANEKLRFGSNGTGEGQFSGAPLVAVTSFGSEKLLYVADSPNGRIQVLDEKGVFKKQIQLNSKEEIKGIEVAYSNYLYVLQGDKILQLDIVAGKLELEGEVGTNSAGVPVYNSSGKEIGKSTTSAPYRIICVGKDSSLYAIDAQNFLVRFDEHYKRTARDKIQITESSNVLARDLAVDESGVIFVLQGNDLLKFAPNGKRLHLFSPQLYSITSAARAIDVDNNGRLYIAEEHNSAKNSNARSLSPIPPLRASSVTVFDTHGRYLGAFGNEDSVINNFAVIEVDRHNVLFISRTSPDGKLQIVKYETPNEWDY